MGDPLQLQHRYVLANGIKIHIAEQGSGPVVILLHGFPEIWYSWRHQLKALAAAGFHAVAPDFRGFGLTENPHGPDRLSFLDLIGDVVGLIQALGQEKVYVAGHDLGAGLGWHICALRPDLVKGYVSFGVPYLKLKSADVGPHEAPEAQLTEGSVLPPHDGFYVNRFMQPGRADADFGRFDTRTVFTNIYKLFSKLDLPVAAESQEIMDLIHPSEPLPTYLSEEDVHVYVEHYEKSGFSNPVRAAYINIQRNSELLSPWADFVISTPALLIVGESDYVNSFPGVTHNLEELRKNVSGLEGVVRVPGCHFFQEESPELANDAFVKFLQKLEAQT